MHKLIWLLVLAIPPWIAAELDAPKWLIALAVVPFFFFASTLGDPDEHLLGDRFAKNSKPLLLVIVIGGLILVSGLLSFFRALLR